MKAIKNGLIIATISHLCLYIETKMLILYVNGDIMKSKKAVLLPKEIRILAELGENLKLARRRRRLTTEQLSERANISRSTLWHVEKGSGHISIGTYLKVLSVLGLSQDMKVIASDDVLGRKLQDAKLITKKRIKK